MCWPPAPGTRPHPRCVPAMLSRPETTLPDHSADIHCVVSVLTAGALGRVGSAVGYTAPDVLVQLARLGMRDLDRGQLQLPPVPEEFAQIGLGEEVHRLA